MCVCANKYTHINMWEKRPINENVNSVDISKVEIISDLDFLIFLFLCFL